MSHIRLRRSHALDHAQVRERVGQLARRLSERYGASSHWEGDDLCIDHSALTGKVSVRPGEVVVDCRLGFALGLFRARAEQEISQLLERELRG